MSIERVLMGELSLPLRDQLLSGVHILDFLVVIGEPGRAGVLKILGGRGLDPAGRPSY